MKGMRNTPHVGKKAWLLLAAVVVFCTARAMTRPAAMLDRACEKPEHTHTDACYTQVTGREKEIPACKVEADVVIHQHDAACYDENGQLWCTLPEVEAHAHTDSCYAVHTHSDACYTRERGELTCTEQPHTHTEECYRSTTTLVCGLSESDGHTEDCCDEAGNLICGQEESEGHTHGEGCYETTRELACGLSGEAHRHTDECYAWNEILTCGQSELPVLVCEKEEILLHTHQPYDSPENPGCYDAGGGLICGMAEIIAHQHTDACFETVTEPVDTEVLICGMEEHTHSEECGGEETTAPAETEPPLTGDTSLVTALEVTAQNREQNGLPWLVRGGGTAACRIHLEAQTYDGTAFPAGRVKLELALPLTAQEGGFDLDAMPWLEDPQLTQEIRTLGEDALPCQVLTGYLPLTPEEEAPSVCADRSVVIRLLAAEPGKEAALQVSAAMEHNTWEGVCPIHQAAERLTADAEPFTTACTLEEAEKNYAGFLALLEGQEEIGESFLTQLTEAYQAGQLTQEAYTELYELAFALIYGSPEAMAEQALGTNWMALRDGGWFEAYSGCVDPEQTAPVQRATRLTRAAYAVNNETMPSDEQIDSRGGSEVNEEDGVSVSKTIAGTELENVFDITLQVQTRQKMTEISREPDMAVVIVLDISNTMNSNFSGVTRYAAAMDAAESFLDQFAQNNSLGVSKVGFVAFNTNATQIFGLQSCKNQDEADALKNRMRTQTGNIINNYQKNENNEVIDPNRFTNMHAGLRMASNMLGGADNKNKFIIFLSDGFPTTYSSDGSTDYQGYHTDDTSLFYDHVVNKPCTYGTNYSDTAAVKARQLAETIKGSGTTIFSIGVDVGGQNLQDYIDSASLSTNHHSTVERSGTSYEIGGTDSAAFTNWLRDGIGSGYYYESTDSAGLSNAFSRIFAEIKTKVEEASRAEWVASDPMPSQSELGHVEFLGFYDRSGTLMSGPLSGTSAENGENTAAFQAQTETIRWDLKASGYHSDTSGGVTLYTYQLVYRVRLENEYQQGVSEFEEGTVYPTNAATTLRYRVVQTVDGVSTISDPRTLAFPVPSVHGYLAELSFRKVDPSGKPLAGAEFTLRHDTEKCAICRGDGTSVAVADMTAVSGDDGSVTFTKIPSGHLYILTETKAPDGYVSDGAVYPVQVAYDHLTIEGGGSEGWTGQIINNIYYELPDTGGPGDALFCLLGAMLTVAAAALITKKRGNTAG